jgi:hypothetical protein
MLPGAVTCLRCHLHPIASYPYCAGCEAALAAQHRAAVHAAPTVPAPADDAPVFVLPEGIDDDPPEAG